MATDDETPTQNTAQQLASQLRGLWSRMPKLARLGGIAVVVVVLGAVLWTSLGAKSEAWQPVAQEMTPEDASELSTLLAGRGIPQRVAKGGKSVEVPASHIAEARVAAASAGLPRGGVGFELFEGVSLGQSSFAEQVNYRRALQGELARSISALAPVEGARVHVALGKRSVFKDSDEPPSASVALRVRPGQHLTPDQVRGVMQLVAASVDGLAADKVVVVDQHGEVLSPDEQKQGTDQAALESSIGQRVRSMLERVVGAGHVAVVVWVEMDCRKVSTSEEIFDKDRAAIRSESHVGGAAVAPAQSVGGIAGVQGNLPGAPAASAGAATAATIGPGGTSTTNYEVTRTVRQTDEPSERIAKLHLAILVDHKDMGDGKLAALPQAQLDELAQLARQAAGFDEKRGDALEIQSFAFVPDEAAAPAPVVVAKPALLPVPMPIAAAAAGGLLVLAALIAFVLKRRGKRTAAPAATTLALPAPLADVERALAARDIHTLGALPPPEPSLQRSIEERVLGAVRADLPRTARVLAGWLAEPDPKPSKS